MEMGILGKYVYLYRKWEIVNEKSILNWNIVHSLLVMYICMGILVWIERLKVHDVSGLQPGGRIWLIPPGEI